MTNSTHEFWTGKFGDEYQERQRQSRVGSIESNIEFFRKVLPASLGSIVELGAGTGQNIEAIRRLKPNIYTSAVEINETAANQIRCHDLYIGSVLDCPFRGTLVLSKGVAIHINPQEIEDYYDALWRASTKYILICEYFSDQRESIDYRGNINVLWKANWYEEITEQYPELHLVNYGFVGKWDKYPQDNLNWWLLEKPDV